MPSNPTYRRAACPKTSCRRPCSEVARRKAALLWASAATAKQRLVSVALEKARSIAAWRGCRTRPSASKLAGAAPVAPTAGAIGGRHRSSTWGSTAVNNHAVSRAAIADAWAASAQHRPPPRGGAPERRGSGHRKGGPVGKFIPEARGVQRHIQGRGRPSPQPQHSRERLCCAAESAAPGSEAWISAPPSAPRSTANSRRTASAVWLLAAATAPRMTLDRRAPSK